MGKKQTDNALLHLYIRGKCNREQLTVVRHYLTDAAYKESLEEFLRSDWQSTTDEKAGPADHAAENYKRFLAAVQSANEALPEITRCNPQRLFFRKAWQAAAMVIGIGLAGFAWWNNDHSSRPGITRWVSICNEAGERTVFSLPDSSKVYLGAASCLEYNTGYGVSNRNLRLKGEAYFIANHQGHYPLAVTTGKITTVDIGTEFNIRFIKNTAAIEVGVAKGLVEILNNTGKDPVRITTLSQRQQIRFDTASHKVEVDTLPEGEIGAWRQGLLVFRKQKLGEVAAELERYYGLTIQFADPDHAGILITTTLQNASAAEALEIVAITAGVRIERNGRGVKIL